MACIILAFFLCLFECFLGLCQLFNSNSGLFFCRRHLCMLCFGLLSCRLQLLHLLLVLHLFEQVPTFPDSSLVMFSSSASTSVMRAVTRHSRRFRLSDDAVLVLFTIVGVLLFLCWSSPFLLPRLAGSHCPVVLPLPLPPPRSPQVVESTAGCLPGPFLQHLRFSVPRLAGPGIFCIPLWTWSCVPCISRRSIRRSVEIRSVSVLPRCFRVRCPSCSWTCSVWDNADLMDFGVFWHGTWTMSVVQHVKATSSTNLQCVIFLLVLLLSVNVLVASVDPLPFLSSSVGPSLRTVQFCIVPLFFFPPCFLSPPPVFPLPLDLFPPPCFPPLHVSLPPPCFFSPLFCFSPLFSPPSPSPPPCFPPPCFPPLVFSPLVPPPCFFPPPLCFFLPPCFSPPLVPPPCFFTPLVPPPPLPLSLFPLPCFLPPCFFPPCFPPPLFFFSTFFFFPLFFFPPCFFSPCCFFPPCFSPPPLFFSPLFCFPLVFFFFFFPLFFFTLVVFSPCFYFPLVSVFTPCFFFSPPCVVFSPPLVLFFSSLVFFSPLFFPPLVFPPLFFHPLLFFDPSFFSPFFFPPLPSFFPPCFFPPCFVPPLFFIPPCFYPLPCFLSLLVFYPPCFLPPCFLFPPPCFFVFPLVFFVPLCFLFPCVFCSLVFFVPLCFLFPCVFCSLVFFAPLFFCSLVFFAPLCFLLPCVFSPLCFFFPLVFFFPPCIFFPLCFFTPLCFFPLLFFFPLVFFFHLVFFFPLCFCFPLCSPPPPCVFSPREISNSLRLLDLWLFWRRGSSFRVEVTDLLRFDWRGQWEVEVLSWSCFPWFFQVIDVPVLKIRSCSTWSHDVFVSKQKKSKNRFLLSFVNPSSTAIHSTTSRSSTTTDNPRGDVLYTCQMSCERRHYLFTTGSEFLFLSWSPFFFSEYELMKKCIVITFHYIKIWTASTLRLKYVSVISSRSKDLQKTNMKESFSNEKWNN